MHNRLFVLDLGRMRMARRSFVGDLADDDPSAAEMVTFPILAYLMEGPDGRVLYDTGCHPDAMKPHGRWSDSFKGPTKIRRFIFTQTIRPARRHAARATHASPLRINL